MHAFSERPSTWNTHVYLHSHSSSKPFYHIIEVRKKEREREIKMLLNLACATLFSFDILLSLSLAGFYSFRLSHLFMFAYFSFILRWARGSIDASEKSHACFSFFSPLFLFRLFRSALYSIYRGGGCSRKSWIFYKWLLYRKAFFPHPAGVRRKPRCRKSLSCTCGKSEERCRPRMIVCDSVCTFEIVDFYWENLRFGHYGQQNYYSQKASYKI